MINLDELKARLINKDQEHKHPEFKEGRIAGIVETVDAIVAEIGKEVRV